MRDLNADERRLSRPGLEIAYHLIGDANGTPIVLANGLGGSWKAWAHQLRQFQDRARFVSWDYRGLYASPRPDSLARLDPKAHAEDGLAILDRENIEGAIVLGWSMGVQVALEIFRASPERVAALVFLNGVAGRTFSSVLNVPALSHVIPPMLRGIGSIPTIAEAFTRTVVARPEAVKMVKGVGLAAASLDESVFEALAGSFAELDMARYMRILEQLGEHDAHDLLSSVDVPTLVVAGDRDVLTPRPAVERMARRIRGADFLAIPGGTHYVAVEYPELVSLRIEKFFEERGYGARNA